MIYFALCIFISAFMLFQVEPMIAKYILPWFGGTPAVWSTVMLFFQVLLTGGYAYAAWLNRGGRQRIKVHLLLLGISLALMLGLSFLWKSPITPGNNWKPAGNELPIVEIFKLLLISVGLPYFLLSSNSPLIQAWFNRAFPGKTAYRLYALSNIGSLLALVTYPVLVEPNLSLAWQGKTWALMYVIYTGLAGYGAVKVLRQKQEGVAEANSQAEAGGRQPAAGEYLLWIGLAAAASVLLLAVTSQITQEVAVIPFLWVLPLTIYLLSFVLAFAGERWYSRKIYLWVFCITTLAAIWALGRSQTINIWLQIGIYAAVLFAACMVCHGELYRRRPHPRHLTSYYLMVSAGGAIGGLLITFVAPALFKAYWELPLGLSLGWVLLMLVHLLEKNKGRQLTFVFTSTVLISMVVIMGIRSYLQIATDLKNGLFIQRNFYGVVRVRENTLANNMPVDVDGLEVAADPLDSNAMVHGVTVHGFQFSEAALRDVPTAYYGTSSGIGTVLKSLQESEDNMRVGILGLGVGTLAAYGRAGDTYRFYEINPLVIALAEGEAGYFSYIPDCQANVEIVPGDARLSLEAELENGHPQNYDVLVLDVFSSDSIPVHLLDEEAFNLYLRHLQPKGILAVHISNSHLDLKTVVWKLADHFTLSRVFIENKGDGVVNFPSEWMLLARDPALLQISAIASRAVPMEGYSTGIRLWTDDYNNLFQILH